MQLWASFEPLYKVEHIMLACFNRLPDFFRKCMQIMLVGQYTVLKQDLLVGAERTEEVDYPIQQLSWALLMVP